MSSRPLGRTLVAAGLVALGLVAALQLEVGEAAGARGRVLRVSLALPSASEAEQVARRWLVPIESSVRALGEVVSIDGHVSAQGASLDVAFEPGVDASKKVARLSSQLASIRTLLPEGSSLRVLGSGGVRSDRLLLLSLTGPEAESRAAEIATRFEAVPGVRAVDVFGAGVEQVRIRLRPGAFRDAVAGERTVRRSLEASLSRRPLGVWSRSGRGVEIVTAALEGGRLDEVPVHVGTRVVPLGTLADVDVAVVPPKALFRNQGRSGLALVIRRELVTPLLQVDDAVARELDRVSADFSEDVHLEILDREADSLRDLLKRIGWGLIATGLAAALFGLLARGRHAGVAMGLSVLVATAGAASCLLILGASMHESTLPAALLGLAAAFPLLVSRGTQRSLARPGSVLFLLSCLAAVPACVFLASERLGPLLLEPAVVFFAAGLGAVLGVLLLPIAGQPSPFSGLFSRPLRSLGRDPLLILLAGAALAHASFSSFGSSLDPRARGVGRDRGSLVIDLVLSSEATLAESVRAVERAEVQLGRIPGVASHRAVVRAGRASLEVRVASSHVDPVRLARVETLMRHRLGATGASVFVRQGDGRRGASIDLGDWRGRQPHTDVSAASYRFLLRSHRLPSLRKARELVRRAVRRVGEPRSVRLSSEWGEPARVLELSPLSSEAALRLPERAAWLSERARPPVSRPLPGSLRTELVVLGPGRRLEESAAPTRRELLGAPLSADTPPISYGDLHDLQEISRVPAVPREDGRFVDQMTVGLGFFSEDVRRQRRRDLDRLLSQLALPAGVQLDRPLLRQESWAPGRWRLLGLAALMPVLLFAIAAVRLNDIMSAAAALASGTAALACVAPLMAFSRLGLDALSLLTIGAVLAGQLPATVTLFADVRRSSRALPAGAATHRSLRRRLPTLLGGGALACLLVSTVSWGASLGRETWVLPLLVASVATAAWTLAAVTTAPALAHVRALWALRDPEEERRVSRPPEWKAPSGPPSLSVKSLTKIYPGGFTALSNVSFDLGPGVVGLLGPNGAGKTTLMRVLTGLLSPTRGEIHYRGIPILPANLARYRSDVGFLPQEFNAFPGLTGEEFLRYWGRERGLAKPRELNARVDRLLGVVGLGDDAKRKVRDYSGGMRQRIGIALTLLTEPPVLIVDEPTTGLDIESRNAFREILLRIASERIVLLSTHLASDVDATATRLLVLDGGRLRFDGTPGDLVARARGRVFEIVVNDEEHARFCLRHRVTARVRTDGGLRLRAVTGEDEQPAGPLVEPSLEEAYLACVGLTGERAAAGAEARRFAFLPRWRREDGSEN